MRTPSFIVLALLGACAAPEVQSPKATLDEGNLTKRRCENDPDARARFPERCDALMSAKPGKQQGDSDDPVKSKQATKQGPVICSAAKDRLTKTIRAYAEEDQRSVEAKEIGDLNGDGYPEVVGTDEGMFTSSWVVSRTATTCYVEVLRAIPGGMRVLKTSTGGWADLEFDVRLNSRSPLACDTTIKATFDEGEYALAEVTAATPWVPGGITPEACRKQAEMIVASSITKRKAARVPPDQPVDPAEDARLRLSEAAKKLKDRLAFVQDLLAGGNLDPEGRGLFQKHRDVLQKQARLVEQLQAKPDSKLASSGRTVQRIERQVTTLMEEQSKESGPTVLRAEARRVKRAESDLRALIETCKGDVKQCETACKGDSVSPECIALGILYGRGDSVKQDLGKARQLLDQPCEKRKPGACEAMRDANRSVSEQREVARTKRQIPRLLAKCDKLKPKLAAGLAQVRAAARRRDSEKVAQLQEELQGTSDELSQTAMDLNDAINDVAGGDSHKWAKMAAEVKRRCVP